MRTREVKLPGFVAEWSLDGHTGQYGVLWRADGGNFAKFPQRPKVTAARKEDGLNCFMMCEDWTSEGIPRGSCTKICVRDPSWTPLPVPRYPYPPP